MTEKAAYVFVFQLDFNLQRQLLSMLDSGDSWEPIAAFLHMPAADVELCRQAFTRGSTPSTEVMRVWSARGYTVDHLYLILATLKHKRAMALIEHKVSDKYRLAARKYNEAADMISETDVGSINVSEPSENQPIGAGANVVPVSDPIPQQIDQTKQPSTSTSAADPQTNLQPSTRKESAQQPTSSMATSAATSTTGGSVASTLQTTMSVRYTELVQATNSFAQDRVIGKGGYGVVYKGIWKHTTVAVKRIISKNVSDTGTEQEKERIRQSLVELKALALYRHDNILPLYGYSLDGAEPCLIYQYMAGGSLEDRTLCRNQWDPLSWLQRRSIILSAARGLNFLHTITAQPLIHGDIKSANILLDQYLESKIGDFGLSRPGQVEMPENATPLIASHIKGTLAYLPPEFIRNKRLSTKLDVYSFGVVMLEVATGQRSYSTQRKPEMLTAYIATHRESHGNDALQLLKDEKAGETGSEFFEILMKNGLRCVDREPSVRPTVNELIGALHACKVDA